MARVIGTLAASGDTQAPTQPQNLSATAINRQRVDLSWTASTDDFGVDGYQIFRNGSPLDIATSTTYSDTTVTASTTYTYVVVAFDAAGNSSIPSASDDATTPANASPTWQTIPAQTLIVGDSYSLNLNNFCTDADADTIQYSIISGTLPSGITLSGAIISGTPTTAGQTPTVGVRAFDGFANVDTTIAFATFTADTTAPPVPTGLGATAVSGSQINVAWNASTDASGGANHFVSGTQDYRVYRSTDQTNFSLRATVTATTYQDTGLGASTRYDYKVSARDVELNESAQSTAVNATTLTSSVAPELEADWQMVLNMPGSSWGHDFRFDAEVDQFRYANGYGHDPNDVARPGQTVWLNEDGITGGCMESRHSGTQNPPDFWRPMAPLNGASNGTGVDDPAVGGTLTLRSYTPNPAGGDTAHNSLNSINYYGNSIYHAGSPGAFVGTNYWLRMRCKISANRPFVGSGPAGDEGGKLLYFTRTSNSNTSQEVVTNSYVEVGSFGSGLNLFSMYRSGSPPIAGDHAVSGLRQIGGEYNGGVCRSSPTVDSSGCWFWPTDETSEGAGDYVTLLYHIVPGTDGGNNTLVEVWKAEWGETSYTRIWRQSDVDLPFGVGFPFGHNAIICSGYQNEISFTEEVWHRYAQISFSHDFQPCPQVYDTTVTPLVTASRALSAGASATTIGGNNGSTGLTSDALGSIQWVNRWFYNHEIKRGYCMGKWQANQNNGQRCLMVYDATTNTWDASPLFHINQNPEIGHVYESFAYDPKEDRLYTGRYGNALNPIHYWSFGDPFDEWGSTTAPPWVLNSNAQQAVICWHPHLFDIQDGGLVAIRLVSGTNMQLVTWRRSTDQWAILQASTAPTQHGAMTWCRYLNALIATHANGNTYRIGIGASGTPATPVQIANPPIPCRHAGGGDNYGILIDDPTGRGGSYIIEKGGTSNRVWQLVSNTWTARAAHALPAGSGSTDTDWCIAEAYPLGGFLCRRDTTAAGSRLIYKPAT